VLQLIEGIVGITMLPGIGLELVDEPTIVVIVNGRGKGVGRLANRQGETESAVDIGRLSASGVYRSERVG
jgi:hypothetical protein